MMSFSDYVIASSATHLQAIEKLNENGICFLIVQKADRVVGTLTDSDLRSALAGGNRLDDTIDNTYNGSFQSVYEDEDLAQVVELFKKKKIRFIPVLSRSCKLVNIVTKTALHNAMLYDKVVDLTYDFMHEDELNVNNEIFIRPWGFYKTTVINDYFQSKVIHIRPNASLSLQLHKRREEYWIIVHGKGEVQLDESKKAVSEGSTLYIPKGCKHRVTNRSDVNSLIITEVQLGDYFGEDDIFRLEDIYGRV